MFPLSLQIRQDLQNNGIDIYPQKEFDEDAEDRLVNEKIRVSSQSSCVAWMVVSHFIGRIQSFFSYIVGLKISPSTLTNKKKKKKSYNCIYTILYP